MRAHRAANPVATKAREQASYERHKDARIAAAIAQSHVRRARMANQGYEHGVTVPALRKRDGDRCHYCDVTMVFDRFPKGQRPSEMATLEHKQPISRGGLHSWANCVLACWRCNSSKGAKDYPAIRATVEANSEAQQPHPSQAPSTHS